MRNPRRSGCANRVLGDLGRGDDEGEPRRSGLHPFSFVSCARVSATSRRTISRLNAGMVLRSRPGAASSEQPFFPPFPGCATGDGRGRIKHRESTRLEGRRTYIRVQIRACYTNNVTLFALLIAPVDESAVERYRD